MPARDQGEGAPVHQRQRVALDQHALKRETSRANGTKFGRPRKVDDAEHIATAKRMKADGHTGKATPSTSG